MMERETGPAKLAVRGHGARGPYAPYTPSGGVSRIMNSSRRAVRAA